jgi:tryptophan synthase alpha chain
VNRLDRLFEQKKNGVLSVYLTAGFPNLNDTIEICRALNDARVDIIEIGIPFSDPVADGETIQKANEKALKNGITLEIIFNQIKEIRKFTEIPLVLMGYLNPVLQYGFVDFCEECKNLGVDGCILPDLPLDEFKRDYQALYEANNLKGIFLITPNSSDQRIQAIDQSSSGFIYAVSSSAITGGALNFDKTRLEYLTRLKSLKLKNSVLLGFGVSTHEDFAKISEYVNGAIVGSAFIRALESGSRNVYKAALDFAIRLRD